MQGGMNAEYGLQASNSIFSASHIRPGFANSILLLLQRLEPLSDHLELQCRQFEVGSGFAHLGPGFAKFAVRQHDALVKGVDLIHLELCRTKPGLRHLVFGQKSQTGPESRNNGLRECRASPGPRGRAAAP